MHHLHTYRKYLLLAAGAGLALVVSFVLFCNLLILHYNKYVLAGNSAQHERVGLVLGAGITKQNKPFKELQARLDVAAAAYHKGQVDKLLVSGDNRFHDYDEPDAMKNYLVLTKQIPADKIQPDYAGRSTYESCERASKIFSLHRVIIYSAGSHLPRAIYLCRHFGIESYGVSSGVEANNAWRREIEARVKAVLNVWFGGVPTILGPRIKI